MHLRPVASALVLIAPLALAGGLAGGAVAAQTDEQGVAPRLTSVELTAGPSTAAADRMSAASADTASAVDLSAAVELDGGVRVVGVTWAAAADAGPVQVEVRHRDAGTWSGWQALEAEAADEAAAGSRDGTEPYVVTGSDRVEARLSASGPVPTDVRLDVVDPGTSTGDAGAGYGTSSVAARPTILTRAQWGADESLRRNDPAYATVRAAVVHHTAGTNSYTEDETAAVIRGIYAFHVEGRGWSDIAYNVLADRFGRLWEGRYGGLDKGVVGAHVAGYNTGSFGISVMGTYETAAPPAATLDAVSRAIAWKLSLSGVPAQGRTTLAGASIPTVVGHRDLGSTACPGQAFYDRLPDVRTKAAAYQAAGTVPPVAPAPGPITAAPIARDLTADGLPDVVSLSGNEVLLSARSRSPVGSVRQIGNGWSAMDSLTTSADLSGDGRADVVARDASTGRLLIFQGDGRGGFRGVLPLGTGWNAMSHVVTPGDWDGDGKADVLATEKATGLLYLYRGSGTGRLAARIQLGKGWGSVPLLADGRDLDGDRRPDLVAADAVGTLRLYSGNGSGGFSAVKVIGSGWYAYDTLLGAGDFDGDGRADLVGRTSGTMTSFFGAGGGSLPTTMGWGNGWDGLGTLAGGSDWDADGRTDLLAVDPRSGALLLYPGRGGRDFSLARRLAAPATDLVGAFVVGDVDGKGGADVVTRDRLGRLHLSLVSGDGVAAAPRQIGNGWTSMDVVTAGGDLSGDGVPDVLAREPATGNLYVYPLTRAGTFGPRALIGVGWNAFDVIIGVGPWDAGPTADVLARRTADGALVLYPGTDRNKLGAVRQIGTGWSGMTGLVGAGDLDRDGAADLLARTAAGKDLVYRGDGAGLVTGTVPLVGLPTTGSWS